MSYCDDRPAVDAQQRRVLQLGREAGRLDDEALDRRAVLALELDLFVIGQPDLVEELLVGVGELLDRAALQHEDLVRVLGLADQGRDRPVLAHRERAHRRAPAMGRVTAPPGHRDAGQVLLAAVLEPEVDARAVGRELRLPHVAVERLVSSFGSALAPPAAGRAAARGAWWRTRAASARGWSRTRSTCRPGSRPAARRRPALVVTLDQRAGPCRDCRPPRPRCCCRSSRRVLGVVAGEGDEAAVGRPHRVAVVVIAGGDLRRLLASRGRRRRGARGGGRGSPVVALDLQAVDDAHRGRLGPHRLGSRLLVLLAPRSPPASGP